MDRRRLLLATAATLAASRAGAATIVDSAGRSVDMPAKVERVFASGPPATVLVHVLAPEKLLGWIRPFQGREADYIAKPWADLPVMGRLTGRGGDANMEVVLAARPDLILDVGSIAPTYVSLADRVQSQTKVPYLLVDGSFAKTLASLDLVGRILGVEERARQLAAYASTVFAEADALVAKVPAGARPRVYLARGANGLETGVRGSINSEIIERVGGINVAEAEGQQGIATVSIEQLLTWNPEVIVTWDRQAFAHVRADPLWRRLRAVAGGRVYLAPSEPFGWIDRPPAINRLLGMRWLMRLLYPAEVGLDLRAATVEFYRLFYRVELDGPRLDHLLADTG